MDFSNIDLIIAIDPGKGGGIAIYRNGNINAVNMPKNAKEMHEYFTYLNSISKNPICFIEEVSMFAGDQAKGGKSFNIAKMLMQFEQIKSMLSICNIPTIKVHPLTWQSRLKLRIKGEEKPARKKRYKQIAQQEQPHLKVTLKSCDSLLILKFGRLVLQNDTNWISDRLAEDYKLL